MTHQINNALTLAVLYGTVLLMLLTTGCAARTPEAKWAQQRQALTSANNLFVEAVDGGLIDDRPALRIGESLQLVRLYLDHAAEELPQGSERFDELLRLADRVLSQVQDDLRRERSAP